MRTESHFIATEFRLIIEGSAAHRPPEGILPERAGHRAGGEETDSGGSFCVSRKGIVRRREYGERCNPIRLRRRAQAGANTWSSCGGDGGPADLKKTEGQGHEHLCDLTSAWLYGTETLAMTERQQQRLQVCETTGYENSKSNEGRQECRVA